VPLVEASPPTILTGADLRRLRRERGLSQQACADALGIFREQWTSWERAHHRSLTPAASERVISALAIADARREP